MLDILLLGINHKTAPVEVRECIAFSEVESKSALQSLLQKNFIKEALLFSTCNRVEILLVTNNKTQAVEETKAFIAEFNKIPMEMFADALYIHEGDDAVRHVFRVASSLDSMVVGEPQILGQVKAAYRAATEEKTSGVVLNRLLSPKGFAPKPVSVIAPFPSAMPPLSLPERFSESWIIKRLCSSAPEKWLNWQLNILSATTSTGYGSPTAPLKTVFNWPKILMARPSDSRRFRRV